LVVQEIAAVLGVREEPLRPLTEALADRLGQEPTLILRDNCEHVLAGAASVAASLVVRCPALSVAGYQYRGTAPSRRNAAASGPPGDSRQHWQRR
jgi:predicted ATPase